MLQHLTLRIRIEIVSPGVPLFHVERYGVWPELWLVRSDDGRLRPLLPTRGIDALTLEDWIGDWPPLASIVAAAAPEYMGAAA